MLYRAASSVDSITDYNEFSPRRSLYLRLLSYLTALLIISLLNNRKLLAAGLPLFSCYFNS